jgi:hypothetical protein
MQALCEGPAHIGRQPACEAFGGVSIGSDERDKVGPEPNCVHHGVKAFEHSQARIFSCGPELLCDPVRVAQ